MEERRSGEERLVSLSLSSLCPKSLRRNITKQMKICFIDQVSWFQSSVKIRGWQGRTYSENVYLGVKYDNTVSSKVMSTVNNCSNRNGKSRLRNFSTKGQKVNISGFVVHMLCIANNQVCHHSTETDIQHVWVKGRGLVPKIILIKDWEVLDFRPNLSVSVLADNDKCYLHPKEKCKPERGVDCWE